VTTNTKRGKNKRRKRSWATRTTYKTEEKLRCSYCTLLRRDTKGYGQMS